MSTPERETRRLDQFFTSFATQVAKRTGSHWSLAIVAVLVIVTLAIAGVVATSLLISIVTLLMVFVLQNTQNRDSASIHLKLDEIVTVQPGARNTVRATEEMPEPEIKDLSRNGSTESVGGPTRMTRA